MELDIASAPVGAGLLDWLTGRMAEGLPEGHRPLRLVVTETHAGGYRCEATVLVENGAPQGSRNGMQDGGVGEFRKRLSENTERFNAVLLVPTGIGASIGGHAGDATPVARLLGAVCDTLVTHPNVVNASISRDAGQRHVRGGQRCVPAADGHRPGAAVRANRVLAVVARTQPAVSELAVTR